MREQIKRISVIFLLVIFCLSICIPVSASQPNESIDEIEQNITDFIVDFYESKDLNNSTHTNAKISDDISVYLENKTEVQQYVTELYNTFKENYKVETILLNTETENNNMLFTFQVITTYNYVGADFETTTSEELYVRYNCDNNMIVDFYAPQNYYDISMRGEEKISEGVLIRSDYNSNNDEIISNKDKLINSIDNVYKAETSAKVAESNEMVLPMAASTINGTAVVNYARNNYNKASPARGKSSVPYYDFSTIPGNYDCTNFVSHALIAGGAKVNDTGGSGISSSGWYFRSISNRSSSWSGVTNLYNYLTTNKKANTAGGEGDTYTLNGAFWGPGSVLQFKASGASAYSHSTIITQKKRSSDKARCYAYVTGRTSKTSYNNNTAAADMFPNGLKRYIWVYNN